MRTDITELHTHLLVLAEKTRYRNDELDRTVYFVKTAENLLENPRAHTVNWLATVEAVESFVDRWHRLPRHRNGSTRADREEARLADWLTTQRRQWHEGRLGAYQRVRLEALPTFRWDPREEHWFMRLDEYDAFLRRRRRRPRVRAEDPVERRLARWVLRQRVRKHQGRLDQAQAVELSELDR